MSTPVPQPLSPYQLNYSQTRAWKMMLAQAATNMRVATPGIVLKFDPVKQTVDVQIAMKELVRFSTGPQWRAITPIYNVPVVLPRSGGFVLTMPIRAGDEGLLVFADSMYEMWWHSGGVQPAGDNPPIEQPMHDVAVRHDFSDAFFIPGCWSQPRVLPNYRTDGPELRNDAGDNYIRLDNDGVLMYAPRTGITIQTAANIIINASGNVIINNVDFMMHTHSGVQSGGAVSGPVVP